ncbi:MAG: hypothetical protein QM713_09900 [Arachnia sp.]
MAVVLVCGATGSPGVTTTALGLALAWPRDVLLADCDRDPSQSLQAGYLRGIDNGGRGLMSLAHVHREGAPLAPETWRQALPLSSGEPVERRFLPGFATAGASRLFEHVWGALGEAFEALDANGADVIVDAGRVSVHGLPLGLLAVADAVLLVTRSSLRSLAGVRIHLATLTEQLRALPSPHPAGLVLVGAGRPYGSAEIAAQFGVPCWAEVRWDPRSADVLSDGAPEPRRFREGAFMGGFRSEAKSLFDRMARARQAAADLGTVPA